MEIEIAEKYSYLIDKGATIETLEAFGLTMWYLEYNNRIITIGLCPTNLP